jgi:threonine/homoserine/homoserine lactone efflux protein
MDIGFWLRGLVLGFSIAAPVGPMGVLCIRRTLADGRKNGLITGLGVASGDTVYGFIAGFGLTFISNILVGQQIWIRLIGGTFLCYLGLKTFFSEPAERPAATTGKDLGGAYLSAFFLTLTNPATILAFTAIFAGMGVGATNGNYSAASILVFGVFCGSGLWWFLLSSGVSLFRGQFNAHRLRWVNRLSGLVIVWLGLINMIGLFI